VPIFIPYLFVLFCLIIEPVQNYDMEDDPEYNVLCDIDFTNGNNLISKKYNIDIIFNTFFFNSYNNEYMFS